MRIPAVCMRPWHKQQIFRDASNSSRFQHSTFCEHPNFGATKNWSSRIWNDQQIGIYGLQVSRIWHGNSHRFVDGLPIKNGDLHIEIHNVRELRIPKLRQEPGLWGWFIPQGESKTNPWKTQRAMARNWALSNLDSLYTHTHIYTHIHTYSIDILILIHIYIIIYIYIYKHIKLMGHGRFSGQHDFEPRGTKSTWPYMTMSSWQGAATTPLESTWFLVFGCVMCVESTYRFTQKFPSGQSENTMDFPRIWAAPNGFLWK